MQLCDRTAAHRRPTSIDVLAMTIALVLCQHAQAQEASGPPSVRVEGLEEVIVTAQKREERAIDVPISISSIDDASITARGATAIEDLQFSVPGLSIFGYGPGGSQFIQLRGISSLVGRPTVGRYVDEMPTNLEVLGVGAANRLVDLERIEVLRGPQPTFYGDGSMGGTIRYVTAKPALKEFSGEFRADLSQMEDGGTGWWADGHVDIPLAQDRAGLRLAGAYEDRSGWIDRVPTGQKDINGAKESVLRGSFLTKLGDASDLSVTWEHNATDMDNQNFGTDRKSQLTTATPLHSDADIVSVSLSVDLGFATLVEAPGYMKYKNETTFDISPFYVPFLTAPPPFGFGLPVGFITDIPYAGAYDTETFFNELRLVSKASEGWTWAVGVDYKDAKLDLVSATSTSPGQLPFPILVAGETQTNKVWSAWAEAGFDLTDKWHVGAGVRYFHDDTDFDSFANSFGAETNVGGQDTFDSTNPRFNLSYKVNDNWNLYVNAAKGFRSGGFNVASTDVPPYRPESLWSYEVGSKGLFFDRKFDLETAVYYNDWKDVQSNFYTPAGLTLTENGGNVKGYGVDVSATLRPTENFSFGGTFGWNNMEYKEVPTDCSSGTCVPTGDKFVGDPVDLAVQMAWSAFADYHHTLSAGSTLYGRADFQHADEAQVTIRRPPFDQVSTMPPRDLLNLRVGMTFGRYDVSLYANNALDDDKPVVQAPFGVLFEDVAMMPRQYGLTLQAKF